MGVRRQLGDTQCVPRLAAPFTKRVAAAHVPADEIGLTLSVCHYPPGTSKWNKIEHRMFCHISQNWRARPLLTRMAVVELIAAATTAAGLKIACELDTTRYAKGIKIKPAQMRAL